MLEFYVIAWALASLTKFAYKYITCESIRIHDQNQILIDSHYHIAAVRYNKTRNRFHVRCQHTSMSERQTKQQIRNIRIHEEKVRVRFTHCRRIGLVVWCIVHRWRRTKKKIEFNFCHRRHRCGRSIFGRTERKKTTILKCCPLIGYATWNLLSTRIWLCDFCFQFTHMAGASLRDIERQTPCVNLHCVGSLRFGSFTTCLYTTCVYVWSSASIRFYLFLLWLVVIDVCLCALSCSVARVRAISHACFRAIRLQHRPRLRYHHNCCFPFFIISLTSSSLSPKMICFLCILLSSNSNTWCLWAKLATMDLNWQISHFSIKLNSYSQITGV